jgi:hypothetical protein
MAPRLSPSTRCFRSAVSSTSAWAGLPHPQRLTGRFQGEYEILLDEGHQGLAPIHPFALQHVDFVHHPVDQRGGLDRQRVGLDPTACLKGHRSILGRLSDRGGVISRSACACCLTGEHDGDFDVLSGQETIPEKG